jgi:glycosyltransferase involved in cell wall biosynthesis
MDWPFFLPAALHGRRYRRLHTVHGTDVFDMARRMKALAIRSARMFSGNFEVVANSRYTLEAFRTNFPHVAAEKTRHVLLGVGDEWLAPPMPVEEARRALNLPADKFVITTTARLVPRKNHLGILEAISRLPPDLKAKLCYLIVGPEGDADYVARLKSVIASTGVDARLMGVPDNQALRKIYAASDLFCLLGRQIAGGPVEGFGLVYLEAGGQGVPALAADTGGVKEVVLRRQNGLVVPAGDAAAATAALAELIGNPVLLADLRQGALQRAHHLSWRRCAAETYGLELGAGC